MTSLKNGSQLESLHTVFVIVYLQEVAWIFTPLIISFNVMIHAFLKPLDPISRWGSMGVFLFFFSTGTLLTASLFLAHQRGLKKLQTCYLWPYIHIKFVRMITILIVSLMIVTLKDYRKTYLHVAVYGFIEFFSSVIAVEIVFRSWKILRRITRRRQRRNENTTRPDVQKALNGAPSISHTESTTVFPRV